MSWHAIKINPIINKHILGYIFYIFYDHYKSWGGVKLYFTCQLSNGDHEDKNIEEVCVLWNIWTIYLMMLIFFWIVLFKKYLSIHMSTFSYYTFFHLSFSFFLLLLFSTQSWLFSLILHLLTCMQKRWHQKENIHL